MAITVEKRRAAVRACETGEGTIDGVAQRFRVGSSTLARWLQRSRRGEDLAPRRRVGGGHPPVSRRGGAAVAAEARRQRAAVHARRAAGGDRGRHRKELWLDAGYAGRFVRHPREQLGFDAEVVKRRQDRQDGAWGQLDLPMPALARAFEVPPRRWVVERTIGWLRRYRRLSKDYGAHIDVAEAWLWVAMLRLLVRRLVHPRRQPHSVIL